MILAPAPSSFSTLSLTKTGSWPTVALSLNDNCAISLSNTTDAKIGYTSSRLNTTCAFYVTGDLTTTGNFSATSGHGTFYDVFATGNGFFTAGGGNRMTLASNVGDGASAIAFVMNDSQPMVAVGAKLLSGQIQGSEKFSIDKDGYYARAGGVQITASPTFTAPTLLNSWANLGGNYVVAGYTKDALGWVHIRGHIAAVAGSVGNACMTLPAGYRMSAYQQFQMSAWNGSAFISATVEVRSDGNVIPSSQVPNGGTLSLDINYLAEA